MFGLFGPPAFSTNDIPDLTGKTAIVTGASSGLGECSSLALAAKGAFVILACRSKAKADATVALIQKDVPNAKLEVMELDLSDLASIKQFAEDYEKKGYDIDILMNNAGIFATPQYSETKQGIELQFGSNHLGPFYLTMLLLPIIERTAQKVKDVRIVNLSSSAHPFAAKNGIDFENLNKPESYSPFGNYGQSKLANILFTRELQKLLDSKNITNIYVNSIHPGVVKTNIQKGASMIPDALLPWLPYLGFTNPTFGSLTQLYCATSPEIVAKNYKAQYFIPTAKLSEPNAFGKSAELAEKLWKWSEDTLKEKGFGL
ncbi:hypothetical protein HDU97_007954 [Phlyctochytrium planicorne]|nr:hypothetical protein HDU97_007954 [Phlyctochytrium planicorne]